LNLLQRGLTLDSANPQLLDRLLSYLGRGGADAEQARSVLRATLSKGEATATTHFLLGMDAWQRDDKTEAEHHWERAYVLAPNMTVLANNLAFLLSHAANADLPRALKMIDQVIDKAPLDPNYRDTRGRIYYRLSRALANDTPALLGATTLGTLGAAAWQGPLPVAVSLIPGRAGAEQVRQAEALLRLALADLEFVLARDPKTAGVHANLAEVYARLGMTDMAREHRRLQQAEEKSRKKDAN
jgi:Tfp pilus assembly protein PilF